MTPDDLSPEDRELAQLALLRIYEGRRRRTVWAQQYERIRGIEIVGPTPGTSRIVTFVLPRRDLCRS